jgi:CHAD domain-containing protein
MKSIAANSLSSSSVAQNQSRLVFDRLSRYTTRISKSVQPANVHRFRTNSRRIEALINELAPEARSKKKTLKLISKFRKKAGKLRDLDVQIAFLKDLKLPDRQNHRAQLLKFLSEEHVRRTRKLAKAADPATVKDLRKRICRERQQLIFDGVDPLQLAYKALPKPESSPLNERTLHACRIAGRRARYLAELAGEAPEAKFFVEELKRAQDAIGEWHDALKLKEMAEKRFGSASESALVSMLQNISRARFRNATNTLFAALTALSRRRDFGAPIPIVQRKATASEVPLRHAAVA